MNKAKLIENIKHLPTTIAGIGAFLAALPQIPAVQSVSHLSPVVANDIAAVGAIGAALVLIFGTGSATK